LICVELFIGLWIFWFLLILIKTIFGQSKTWKLKDSYKSLMEFKQKNNGNSKNWVLKMPKKNSLLFVD